VSTAVSTRIKRDIMMAILPKWSRGVSTAVTAATDNPYRQQF
jgi:hypothetical protein